MLAGPWEYLLEVQSHITALKLGVLFVQMYLSVVGDRLAQVAYSVNIYRTSSSNFEYPGRTNPVEMLFTYALIRMVLLKWSVYSLPTCTQQPCLPCLICPHVSTLLSWGWIWELCEKEGLLTGPEWQIPQRDIVTLVTKVTWRIQVTD